MFQLSQSHNHNGNYSVENKYITIAGDQVLCPNFAKFTFLQKCDKW